MAYTHLEFMYFELIVIAHFLDLYIIENKNHSRSLKMTVCDTYFWLVRYRSHPLMMLPYIWVSSR